MRACDGRSFHVFGGCGPLAWHITHADHKDPLLMSKHPGSILFLPATMCLTYFLCSIYQRRSTIPRSIPKYMHVACMHEWLMRTFQRDNLLYCTRKNKPSLMTCVRPIPSNLTCIHYIAYTCANRWRIGKVARMG
jgi:hypothetical protein